MTGGGELEMGGATVREVVDGLEARFRPNVSVAVDSEVHFVTAIRGGASQT